MSLEEIVKTLKKPKEEMSSISFNIPLKLKEQLTNISKENDFTTNAFLVAIVDNVLNGELRDKKKLEVIDKLSMLFKRKEELESKYGMTNSDRDFIDGMGDGLNYKLELENIDYMIKLLKDV